MAHLLLSASHKSSGKTTLSIGLCAALTARGVLVSPFKKGPDYIDPLWLGAAAGRPCHNLDFHTQSDDEIRALFARQTAGADLALIEGNLGLYDGMDLEGSNSNAALAHLLQAPVVLVIDAQGMTRSVAALLLGFQSFDPELQIAGVILNKVHGERHEGKLRAAIEHYTDIPLLGAVQRDPELAISERHLGLVPSNEQQEAAAKIGLIAGRIAEQVDLEAVLAAARNAPALALPPDAPSAGAPELRIAVARDAAFGFYYEDDLEALRRAGAEPVFFDTLHDAALPEADGLFIGGGFPETHMPQLAANSALRTALRTAIEAGLPVYAECGGLMYLTRSIRWKGERFEMVGALPADTVMHERPVGRGYVRLRETADHPWPGARDSEAFSAHEFHHSSLENVDPSLGYAYQVLRGTGIDGQRDGIVHRNVLAGYAHQRDTDANHWCSRFVDFVRRRAAGGKRARTAT